MNKYLEALDDVAALAYDHGCISVEGVIARDEHVILLQELVDRATPTKIVLSPFHDVLSDQTAYIIQCPSCKYGLGVTMHKVGTYFENYLEGHRDIKFCSDCGKALDWSKDDE